MYKIRDFYMAMDRIAPFKLAESWDNVGLNIGGMDDRVNKVLLALDVTSKVIEEAKQEGANLIITHHPVIFDAIKTVSSDDLVYKLAQNGIGVIAAHTNLDIVEGGINDLLAELIGLEEVEGLSKTSDRKYYSLSVFVPETHVEQVYNAVVQAGAGEYGSYSGCMFSVQGEGRFLPLAGARPTVGEVGKLEKVAEKCLTFPVVAENKLTDVIKAVKASHPYEEPSFSYSQNLAVKSPESCGRVGMLKTEMNSSDFAKLIKSKINATAVNYTEGSKPIKKVALCSGSGGGFLNDAIGCGADAYFTGELKYDLFLRANEAGMAVFEAGHFQTETVIFESLKVKLQKEMPDAQVLISKKSTDGIFTI